MKRSTGVRLVLLGSAASITACDTQPIALQQQRYATQEECQRDWGDPQDCRPAGHIGGGGYFGPRYYWDDRTNQPMSVHDDGSVHAVKSGDVAASGRAGGEGRSAGSISRGGFGGGGHRAGAGS